MVERVLSMHEAPGSIPGTSTFERPLFLSLFTLFLAQKESKPISQLFAISISAALFLLLRFGNTQRGCVRRKRRHEKTKPELKIPNRKPATKLTGLFAFGFTLQYY